MQESIPSSRLLTMPEAAERLSMSSRWVRQMVADKQIPAVRLGRSIRLYPEDVEAFARRHHDSARG